MLVFAEAHMELPVPLFKARERLTSYVRDRERLSRDSVAALRCGPQLADRDGPVTLRIDVLTAVPRFGPGVTRVPVRWIRDGATDAEMPLLDATLELTESAAGRGVRLTAVGSYRPWPQSSRLWDEDAAQGAAEATFRALLTQVAKAITQ